MPAWPAVDIAAGVLESIVGAAHDARPRECCGLLIGTRARIVGAFPAANLAVAPTRYDIAPADHFAALRAARAAGLEVVGCYHSHPHGPARPSPTDRLEAVADFLYLIVGLGESPPDLGLWVLADGNFAPVRLVRTEGAGEGPPGGR